MTTRVYSTAEGASASSSSLGQQQQLLDFETAMRDSWNSFRKDLEATHPHSNSLHYCQSDFLSFFRTSNLLYADGVSNEVQFARDYDQKEKLRSSGTTTSSIDTSDILQRYEAYRRHSAGAMALSAFGHLVGAPPLPGTVYQDPAFLELLLTLSLLTGIHNDLISYAKDDSWDMMAIFMHEISQTATHTYEAKWFCLQRNQDLLHRYRHDLRDALTKTQDEGTKYKVSEQDSLVTWVDTILPMYMKGILAWQCHVKRYEATNNQQASSCELFDDLFGTGQQEHILVDETTGLIPGEDDDGALRAQINKETAEWARETGLIPLCSERKWNALDLGLAALLVHHYCSFKDEANISGFVLFAKYLGWIIVIDDAMEESSQHEHIKSVFVECMDLLATSGG